MLLTDNQDIPGEDSVQPDRVDDGLSTGEDDDDSGEENDILMEDSDLEDQLSDENEQPETETNDTTAVGVSSKSNKKKKSKESKKVGSHRQKKLIHTLLKLAKIYEIRKLTRRINTLKSAKGTDEQIAKNNRKAERLSQEITCIREFMIDQLTERLITIFKKKAEERDTKLWESCESPSKTNEMIQILSETKEEGSHVNIAFLRMISSKDVVGKFQKIFRGENLNSKPKSKKKGKGKGVRPQGTKQIKKAKQMTVNNAVKEDGVENERDGESQSANNDTNEKKTLVKPKKIKMKKDSFFVDHEIEVDSDSDDASDISGDGEEEFTAPVMFDTTNPDIQMRKKNRMGQRDRKRIQDKKHGRYSSSDVNGFRDRGRGRDGGTDRFSQDRRFSGQNRRNFNNRGTGGYERDGYSRGGRDRGRGRGRGDFSGRGSVRGSSNFTRKALAPPPKKVDETLHPSWQAKQKQKARQSITGFAGTKITFDD